VIRKPRNCVFLGSLAYHPCKGGDGDVNGPGPLECLGTGINRRTCRHDIINDQNAAALHRAGTFRPYGNRATQVFDSLAPVEAALGRGRTAPNQQVGNSRFSGPFGQRIGEQGGLVEASSPQSRRMERNRTDHVCPANQALAGTLQPLGKRGQMMQLVAAFEPNDQLGSHIVVAQRRARQIEGRRMGQTATAEGTRALSVSEGQPAAGATGRRYQFQVRPAAWTQRTDLLDDHATGKASQRQHGVDQTPADMLQGVQHRHRSIGPFGCPAVNHPLPPLLRTGKRQRMNESSAPFDRRAHRLHRDRAAAQANDHSEFLFREVGERLLDRLEDITRDFPLALELGARDGWLRAGLQARNGIATLIQSDLSAAFLEKAQGLRMVADEELPPIATHVLDLAISNLAFHWVNDLPGALSQIRRCLKPDGLFLASVLGGDTLSELREVLSEAEIAVTGGLSPRLSPMVDVRDAGALLQRAGFALPVVDIDRIDVSYPDALALMRDLRAMGETNAVAERSRAGARRDVLLMASALYGERHGDAEGRINATFDVLFLTGWAPHESQQQPLRPGSGQISLTQVLGDGTDQD